MKKKMFLMTLIMAFSLAVSFCSYAGTNNTAYSPYWNIDSANNWHYTLANGQVVTDAWIQDEVSGDWYLIDSVGNMKSGLVTSNGKYYLLDNTRGTGHFGKLLKNGEYYNGVLILADTSASYQGALSESTINQLTQMGVNVYTAENVTGTKQVSNGTIVSDGSTNSTANGSLTQSSNTASLSNNAVGTSTLNTSTGKTYTKGLYNKVRTGTGDNDFKYIPIADSDEGLIKYHNTKRLTQSEIDILVNQYGLQIADMISGARPPFSQNRVALINYIDDNKCLVMVGDDVDVTGCYDYAAGGYCDSLATYGLNLQH